MRVKSLAGLAQFCRLIRQANYSELRGLEDCRKIPPLPFNRIIRAFPHNRRFLLLLASPFPAFSDALAYLFYFYLFFLSISIFSLAHTRPPYSFHFANAHKWSDVMQLKEINL